jgi:hypothetical protein
MIVPRGFTGNATCIAALLDRLTHHAEVTLIEQSSKKFTVTEAEVKRYEEALSQELSFDPSSGHLFNYDSAVAKFLAGCGLLDFPLQIRFGYSRSRHALVIPLYWDGVLTGLRFRALDETANKWIQAPGSKADYLWLSDLPPIDPYSGVVGVFEGVRDTALARSLGFNAVGILSATSVPENPSERFTASVKHIRETYKHVLLIGDADRAGTDAMKHVSKYFAEGHSFAPRLPEPYKDLTEFFEAEGDINKVVGWLESVYTAAAASEARLTDPADEADPLFRVPEKYPIEVWDGTIYGEFARVCTQGNYIPPEFFVESLKTVVGAIAGHRMGIEGADLEARFYTTLIGEAGLGKTTAIMWARELFPPELCYTHGVPLHPDIGCYVAEFGSQVGLVKKAKTHSQIFQICDEFSNLSDKFKIAGSGTSYVALLNQLYEKTLPPSNITKDSQEDVGNPVHFSLLAATTPDVWAETFGKTGTEGSGFFQRLSIFGNEEKRTVSFLRKPDFAQFAPLIDKVKKLLETPYQLRMSDEAAALLNRWHDHVKIKPKELDTGRLQVLALRNAVHLGWLLDGVTMVEVIRRAIALSNWQLAMRKAYRPILGDTPYAQLENMIIKVVQQQREISRRELSRLVHADRAGLEVFNRALSNVAREGYIRIEHDKQSRGRPSQRIHWAGD